MSVSLEDTDMDISIFLQDVLEAANDPEIQKEFQRWRAAQAQKKSAEMEEIAS